MVVLAMNVCGLGTYWLCAGDECVMFKYKNHYDVLVMSIMWFRSRFVMMC